MFQCSSKILHFGAELPLYPITKTKTIHGHQLG